MRFFNQVSCFLSCSQRLQSVLEEACLSLGFSLQSAHLLFERLDTRKKGFITPSEWGNRELAQTIEAFSLMYLRRFLGLPDVHASPVEVGYVLVCGGVLTQPFAACTKCMSVSPLATQCTMRVCNRLLSLAIPSASQTGVHAAPSVLLQMQKYFQAQQQKQIKSLPIAVNLMRVNAVTRGANSALNCGDVIYNAFSFIDADSSGNLSRVRLCMMLFSGGTGALNLRHD